MARSGEAAAEAVGRGAGPRAGSGPTAGLRAGSCEGLRITPTTGTTCSGGGGGGRAGGMKTAGARGPYLKSFLQKIAMCVRPGHFGHS